MDEKYPHLNEETKAIVEKNLEEKLNWVRHKHFIPFSKAMKCLGYMEWLYERGKIDIDSEFPSDMDSFTIMGDSGSGKSMIADEFINMHKHQSYSDHEEYPVAYTVLKAGVTGLKGLYSALLTAVRHPMADSDLISSKKITIDYLEELVIHTYRATKTIILVIDEFQHLLGPNQQAIINQIKRTMLLSRVRFIPMGITQDTKKVLGFDIQLANRCPVKRFSHLELWSNDVEFRKFLLEMEHFLPFPEPSDLSKEDVADYIFNSVQFLEGPIVGKTNLRNIVQFVNLTAEFALNHYHKKILKEDLESAREYFVAEPLTP